MPLLTLLEGHTRLGKTYKADGSIDSYPLVKKVTSFVIEHDLSTSGLQKRANEMRRHAHMGLAMHKGPLTRTLNRESRAGAADINAPTNTILLDIDGVEIAGITVPEKITKADITLMADAVIRHLPAEFQNRSYIVHASSSLGLKGNKICMHLEFFLSREITPIHLKRWLQYLNFSVNLFTNQLDLTATGTALRWKLDVSLADNTKLIYIAPPTFIDRPDPVENEEDRIFFVERQNLVVDPIKEEDLPSPIAAKKEMQRVIDALRVERGLGPSKAKTINYRFNDQNHAVVVNPDSCNLEYAYENERFVYYNLNGGDSNAYYVYKHKPDVVWNFKGEPPFLFEAAAPDLFNEHIEKYITHNEEAAESGDCEPVYVAFNDRVTDVFYRGTIDRVNNTVIYLNKTNRSGAYDWLADNNAIVPEVIPIWEYTFDPTTMRRVDIRNKFINQFNPSVYLTTAVDIPDHLRGLTYNNCELLAEACPSIHKILRSVTGQDDKSYRHFVNWLAWIFVHRTKPQTAWVLHGVEGTGKGVLFNKILRPILGNDHAVMVRLENIDEQYNGWLAKALIVMVDEFRQSSAKKGQAIAEKLRNYITEERLTIRNMHSTAVEMNTYMGFILAGNDRDIIDPPETDRRYNIAPRQNQKLFHQYPEFDPANGGSLDVIDTELHTFATIMMNFVCAEQHVRTPMENEAKQAMRQAAQSVVTEFFDILYKGNVQILGLLLDYASGDMNNAFAPTAKTIAKAVLQRAHDSYVHNNNDPIPISLYELMTMFQGLMNRQQALPMFKKMVERHGFRADQVNINNEVVFGIYVKINPATLGPIYENFIAKDLGRHPPVFSAPTPAVSH